MRQQTRPLKEPAEKVVQDIRRATRKHYSAEEKIRIVLEGLRGEDSIAELCRPSDRPSDARPFNMNAASLTCQRRCQAAGRRGGS